MRGETKIFIKFLSFIFSQKFIFFTILKWINTTFHPKSSEPDLASYLKAVLDFRNHQNGFFHITAYKLR